VSDLRLGTDDREEASAALAEHFAQGRLDHDEYAERLDRIWAAKVRSDLTPVFRDLPGPSPLRSSRTAVTRAPRAGARPPRRRLPFPVLALVALVVAAVVLTHLPLVLVALAVWFLFLRGRCRPAWTHRRW
jgi:Flp pilus assembly protein TadB